MRMVLATEKLKKLFEYSFIDDTYSDVIFRFQGEKGLFINEAAVIKGVGVVGIFGKEFFNELECEIENVIIPDSFQKILKKSAFKGTEIELYTDTKDIHLKSGKDHYKETLTAIPGAKDSKEQIRLKKTLAIKMEPYGLTVDKNFEPIFIGKVKTEELNMPSEKNTVYAISNKGGKLNISAKLVGQFDRNINPEETIIDVDTEFTNNYDSEIFSKMVKQFLGNTYLTIEDAGYIFFTEKTSEHSILFLLGPMN